MSFYGFQIISSIPLRLLIKRPITNIKSDSLLRYLIQLELPPITNFILPGGNSAAAHIHQVRTIIRRAETLVVKLSDKDEINSNCIKYLNRLSDLMFVLGRLINKRNGIEDIIWKP